MYKVRFYDQVEDELLKFAVVISKYNGKWVFCRNKERKTYECPCGCREAGEDIGQTAERELYGETGAREYELNRICVYSVQEYDEGGTSYEESFGMLHYAEIDALGELPPDSEMECIELFTDLPSNWTYPEIQPLLIEKVAFIIGDDRGSV